jgi:hypothetical protein
VFISAARPALPKKVRRERLIRGVDQLLVEAVRVGCQQDEVLELVDERVKHFQWQSSSASTA